MRVLALAFLYPTYEALVGADKVLPVVRVVR